MKKQCHALRCTIIVLLSAIGILIVDSMSPVYANSLMFTNIQKTTTRQITASVTIPLEVDNLEDAQLAIIQIESVGSFESLEEGTAVNRAGSGSGFIIDESGIAVTNHHVVTGGAFFKIYISGEDRPRNARILGVSECTDLAVLDIQGDGFNYLGWYTETVKVGLDVYAAGFPLGDPEYTLTRGIISKARANGDSQWASVEHVLQHDAVINPGSSGGPLIDRAGRVVGINYAANLSSNQYFAIAGENALPIIEQLQQGIDIDTLGINGRAIAAESVNGIFVASIASGSPADTIGLLPGDLIIELEGLELAENGTMNIYCNILRSHAPDDVLRVKVLRRENDNVIALEGQFNGRPLEQPFSMTDDEDDTSSSGEGSSRQDQSENSDDTARYEDYVTITNETEELSLDAPVVWSDVLEGDWVIDDEVVGTLLAVSPDLGQFSDSWGVPAIILRASNTLIHTTDEETLLDDKDLSEDCTYEKRGDYTDGLYTGYYDIWGDCGEDESVVFIIAAAPESRDFLIRLDAYLVTEADTEALEQIIDTFLVDLPPLTLERFVNEDSILLFNAIDSSRVNVAELENQYTAVVNPALNFLSPVEWDSIESNDWVVDEDVVGLNIHVSSNARRFPSTNWSTSGISVYTAFNPESQIVPGDLLDNIDHSEECTYSRRVEHEHSVSGFIYTGSYDIWTECGGEDNALFVLVAAPDGDADHFVVFQLLALEIADIEAFELLEESFFVGDFDKRMMANPDASDGDDEITFTQISDNTGALSVNVPIQWTETNGNNWANDGDVLGPGLSASADLEDYNQSWNESGVFIGYSEVIGDLEDTDEILDIFVYESCETSDRYTLEDIGYIGEYDLLANCGDDGAIALNMVLQPDISHNGLVVLKIRLSARDISKSTIYEQILSTLTYNPALDTTAGQEGVVATVRVQALNVRAGPGTNYARLDAVTSGTELQVLGQYNSCSWLKIRTPDEIEGWVSGSTSYVRLSTACSQIPETTR
ncbi:MAG: trypsin-like peptidase domain-containing protein [Chloroflexota bacterium]